MKNKQKSSQKKQTLAAVRGFAFYELIINYFAPNAKHKQIKLPPSSCVSPTAVPPLHTLREPTASASRGATLGTHIERYRPLIMPLVHGRKKSTLARSLVLFVKFGTHRLAAVAARVPSSKGQSSCISTLRIGVRQKSALQVRGRRFHLVCE